MKSLTIAACFIESFACAAIMSVRRAWLLSVGNDGGMPIFFMVSSSTESPVVCSSVINFASVACMSVDVVDGCIIPITCPSELTKGQAFVFSGTASENI